MKELVLTILLFAGILPEVHARKWKTIGVLTGPALIKYDNRKYDFSNKALYGMFYYSQNFTKRSGIEIGLGFTWHEKLIELAFDTTFQDVGGGTGCNCGYYDSRMVRAQFNFPVRYKFIFLKRDNFEAALTAGLELVLLTQDKWFASSYRRNQDNTWSLGPFYHSGDELDYRRRLLISPTIAINVHYRINDNWSLLSGFSINYNLRSWNRKYDTMNLAVGVGYRFKKQRN